MAKVVKQFDGVADGDIYPTTFAIGDDVTGNLAAIAIANGWATEGAPAPKAEAKPGAKQAK